MKMDKQSKQAALTTETTFRKRFFAQYAGLLVLVVFLLMNNSVAVAADAEADSAIAEEMIDGASHNKLSAEEIVDNMIEEWLEGGTGRKLKERDDLNKAKGTSLVMLKTDDRQWGQARALAFEDAFVQAMAEYVGSLEQKISSETERKYFADLDSKPEYQAIEASDSYISRIIQKTAVLAEHELDQLLTESGMDPSKIKHLTPVQKRTQLSDSMEKEMNARVFGDAVGFVPIKTFEALDNEGNSSIGVVAIYSESMRRIAEQISQGKAMRPDPSRARRSIEDQIYAYGVGDLPHEFGVRLMWDEQGYPAIVSFAQWGWAPSNLDKEMRAHHKKAAKIQATNLARSQLATFINSRAAFTDSGWVGKNSQVIIKLSPDGVQEKTRKKTLENIVEQTGRIQANVNLRGVTSVRSWTARHPLIKEQQMVGEIIYWSPAREDAINRTVGEEAKHAPAPQEIVQEKPKKQVTGTVQSRDPELDDF